MPEGIKTLVAAASCLRSSFFSGCTNDNDEERIQDFQDTCFKIIFLFYNIHGFHVLEMRLLQIDCCCWFSTDTEPQEFIELNIQ